MKSGRRSFVKQSMAAPFVLTIGSSPAQAAGSNAVCIARDAVRAVAGPGQPQPLVAAATDDWLRIEVELFELKVWDGNAFNVVAGEYFLGSDRITYWRLAEGAATDAAATPSQYTATTAVARALGKRRYALVVVDASGTQTGFAWEGRSGGPITASCWTSVRPLRA